jgi:dihydropteroate synthase
MSRRAGSGGVELWGVLNVTPDSFSDGGRFVDVGAAIAHAERMHLEGADVIDVGGASSRPPGKTYGAGAQRLGADEEIARAIPVVEALASRGMVVSIDTTDGEVAERALGAGAGIGYDVSMGASERLLYAVAASGAELVLMHTRGDGVPGSVAEGPMGAIDARTSAYRDLVGDVIDELEIAVHRAIERGVAGDRIWIDPGIGFAKTPAQSAALIGATSRLVRTEHRVLVGASRKSFIAALAPGPNGAAPGADARLPGSLAAVTAAVLGGAHAVRVHDVAESRQAALVALAIAAGGARTARASEEAARA